MISELAVRSFDSPDETVAFDNGRSERVTVDERTFWRSTVEPGWRFSRDNAPDLGTERCPSPHRLYVVTGRLTVETDDARETLQAGDVALIPPGHDAWTDGEDDELTVFVEETFDE
ncbi:cupin domain-containing protein [Natronococcus occultus]|uniref:Cupin domain-containing protein n=1 Tax=Natronococcus occultus SP4 TaxID=694430 RepID=L0K2S1_9EURY|nr:cupin domain-containing protein [Natronococcus occultus]AGB38664.1 cupin domain-containing protein [Natronococcus occultus SP4]